MGFLSASIVGRCAYPMVLATTIVVFVASGQAGIRAESSLPTGGSVDGANDTTPTSRRPSFAGRGASDRADAVGVSTEPSLTTAAVASEAAALRERIDALPKPAVVANPTQPLEPLDAVNPIGTDKASGNRPATPELGTQAAATAHDADVDGAALPPAATARTPLPTDSAVDGTSNGLSKRTLGGEDAATSPPRRLADTNPTQPLEPLNALDAPGNTVTDAASGPDRRTSQTSALNLADVAAGNPALTAPPPPIAGGVAAPTTSPTRRKPIAVRAVDATQLVADGAVADTDPIRSPPPKPRRGSVVPPDADAAAVDSSATAPRVEIKPSEGGAAKSDQAAADDGAKSATKNKQTPPVATAEDSAARNERPLQTAAVDRGELATEAAEPKRLSADGDAVPPPTATIGLPKGAPVATAGILRTNVGPQLATAAAGDEQTDARPIARSTKKDNGDVNGEAGRDGAPRREVTAGPPTDGASRDSEPPAPTRRPRPSENRPTKATAPSPPPATEADATATKAPSPPVVTAETTRPRNPVVADDAAAAATTAAPPSAAAQDSNGDDPPTTRRKRRPRKTTTDEPPPGADGVGAAPADANAPAVTAAAPTPTAAPAADDTAQRQALLDDAPSTPLWWFYVVASAVGGLGFAYLVAYCVWRRRGHGSQPHTKLEVFVELTRLILSGLASCVSRIVTRQRTHTALNAADGDDDAEGDGPQATGKGRASSTVMAGPGFAVPIPADELPGAKKKEGTVRNRSPGTGARAHGLMSKKAPLLGETKKIAAAPPATSVTQPTAAQAPSAKDSGWDADWD